jgi:hypothetical protein
MLNARSWAIWNFLDGEILTVHTAEAFPSAPEIFREHGQFMHLSLDVAMCRLEPVIDHEESRRRVPQEAYQGNHVEENIFAHGRGSEIGKVVLHLGLEGFPKLVQNVSGKSFICFRTDSTHPMDRRGPSRDPSDRTYRFRIP